MIGAIVGIILIAIFIYLKSKVSDKIVDHSYKKDPENIKNLLKVAEKFHLNKNYSAAQETYEKVIQLDPQNLIGNCYLGFLNYRLPEKKDLAEKPLQIATMLIKEIQTTNINKQTIGIHIPFDLAAETLFRYGYILHKKGQESEAQFYKKMAIRIHKIEDSNLY